MQDVTVDRENQVFSNPYDASDVRDWLTGELSTLLAMPREDFVDGDKLSELGLDSSALISLTQMLEDRYQIIVPPSAVFDQPKIGEFCAYIAKLIAENQP